MNVKPGILFNNCYGKFAIAAVNIWSMEQVLALFSAAHKSQSPFIVQTTPAARNYATPAMLPAMIDAGHKLFPDIIFSVHLDHGNEEHIADAIESGGYNSVMIDASHDSFDVNIKRTFSVVGKAHEAGLEVEAELGVLAGVEDDITSLKSKYTRPEEVEEFVNKTQCDSLAIAVGTSHGAYKFSGGAGIQFDILEEIGRRMPGYPLVLHGGSGVDINEIERINKAGGTLGKEAQGVPDDQLKKAIQLGICKVNIATDARLIWTRAHREFFRDAPGLIDPVIPGKTFISEFEKFLIEKFEVLGATGENQFIKLPIK
jgi:fructose-bisphosphate aldolase, class II